MIPQNLTLWQSILIGWVGAILANLALLQFVKPLAPDFMSLSALPIIFWTSVAIMGASAVFVLIRKYSTNPAHDFMSASIAALLLSFGMDIPLFFYDIPFFTGKTTGGIISLMVMHVVVALIIVPILLKFTRRVQ